MGYMVDVHGGPPPGAFQGGNPSSKQYHRANSVTIRTVPMLINFYHMTLGAPSINTWLNAIDKGWFTSFPGLTSQRVRQYCTNKMETAKGHLKLQRQHVQSTKPTARSPRNTRHTISTHLIEA